MPIGLIWDILVRIGVADITGKLTEICAFLSHFTKLMRAISNTINPFHISSQAFQMEEQHPLRQVKIYGL